MDRKKNRGGLLIVHLAFFALFPAFFFYHTALGTGLISPFLGGYFSWVALAFTPMVTLVYLSLLRKDADYLTWMDIAFFGYLMYFAFVVLFNLVQGADEELVRDHLVSIIQFASIFLIFRTAEFNRPYVLATLVVSLLAMSGLIFYLSIDGNFYLKREDSSFNTESLASYQGFARSYFVTAVAAVVFLKPLVLRLLIYSVAIPALFLNGARSELIGLAVFMVLSECVGARNRLLIIASALGVIALVAMNLDHLLALLPSNRTLELFDASGDTSWQARNYLLSHGLRTIADHPLLGDYGSYVPVGGAGGYIHNILSAWVDTGLFGFLYLLALILIPLVSVSYEMATRSAAETSKDLILVFGLLASATLLVFTAKNFTDPLIPIALGRYAYYRTLAAARRRQPRNSFSRPLGAGWTRRAIQ